ncbi:MAG: polymer-forming cytoskeletal protein [Alphaproteobacteria bacterium]|nr:polymer-forming cytoskeletal protein [Alphaproteobacteria bacterium]
MFHRPATSDTLTSEQGEKENMSQAPQNTESNESSAADRSVDIPSSPFQRPGQPAPAAMPSAPRAAAPAYNAYPSAYGVGAPSSSASASTSADAASRRLIIGQGITMSGEIESCDLLVVEGTVEAALKGASVLEIAETGMFYGTVEIDEATIAGKFEGDLTVNGRLTVRSTGSITGAISYKELAVEAGALIDGKITPLGSKGASSEKKSHREPSKSGAPVKKKAEQISPEEDDLPILQRAAGH